ncbi:hypothetical protein [Tautonia plasticadhaerens]|uniref:VWFA domain-containing protein n=1 Tax=Tautonia plasticadhaerens TaxID=2527974 RepID=A0A518H640_9BACT|nr:hypothetical protein [Tautonia plasticadhaerens]QDV36303.1 hypothetical protein ElP_42230 [Tautonia plasticadhaerens]
MRRRTGPAAARIPAPWALAVALLLTAGTAARGQQVEIPGGKPVPQAFMPAPVDPDPITGEIPENAPRVAWRVWAAHADFRPRSRPELASPPAFGSRGLSFLEPSHVLMKYQGSDNHEYLLLASGTPATNLSGVRQVLGWVPRDYVIDEARAERSAGSAVPVKAMLVNDAERPDTFTEDTGAFQEAVWTQAVPEPLDDEAGRKAYRLKQYALFNIFWIYARTPHGPLTSTAEDRDRAWLLIGTSPNLTIDAMTGSDNASEVIQGWVPERRALLWLTREGLAWDRASTLPQARDRRKDRGAVYTSAGDAYAASYPETFAQMAGGPAPAQVEAIATEGAVESDEGGWESVAYKPHHMRMPRLNWPGPFDEDKTEFPERGDPTGKNELIRVGSISGFDGLSPEEVADRNQKLDEIGRLLEVTEILFVIDDTISMGVHFEAVAKAVEAIEKDAKSLESRQRSEGGKAPLIRAAVSFYNDTDGRPEGAVPYSVMPLRPAAEFGGSIAREVRGHATNNGGDEREMVFFGLAKAIEAAHFSAFSRKVVVLIGDAGDKSDPEDPSHAEAVGRLFRPASDAPIELVSVQVVPPQPGAESGAFDRQVRHLAAFLNGSRREGGRTLGRNEILRPGQELDELLSETYEEVVAEARRKRLEIDQLRAGDFNTEIGGDIKAILRRLGIDVDAIRRQSEGKFQLFRPGYVWRYPQGMEGRSRQVRDVVLLNGAEIQDLITSLEKIADWRFGGPQRSRATKEGLRELIDALVGEYADDNISFQEAMRRRMELRLRTGLLALRPKAGELDVSLQHIEDIHHRVSLLRDIVADQERDWVVRRVPDGNQELIIHTPGPEVRQSRRWFTIPGGSARWYWIDVEDELP